MSVKLIFGAGGIGKGSISHNWTTPEQTNEVLTSLRELGFEQLDSGASYPPGAPWVTETLLGQSKAAEKGFLIDSKIITFAMEDRDPKAPMGGHSLTEANIDASIKKSFELLGVDKVNILHTNMPDPVTPVEESARAFDKHFRAGHFNELGLSNHNTTQMKEWLRVCDEKGYVKPTVYQGHYNALCRHPEATLYPLLREHGIRINAFGPLAGGFLTGKVSLATPETDLSGSRWVPGGHSYYPATFDKPAVHEAMKTFSKKCEEMGISSTEASLRWLVHHSALKEGDGTILGATRLDQLEGNLEILKMGSLDERVVNALDELWEAVKEGTGVTAVA